MANKKAANAITPESLLEDAAPDKSIDLTQITNLALEMLHIEARLEKWQQEVKKLMDRYNAIEQEILPDLMAQANLSELTLSGGTKVVIARIINGSIPSQSKIEDCDDPMEKATLQERRTAAMKWLRANKAAELIRSTLKAEFGPGHAKDAKQFFKDIQKAGYKVSADENVHPATLNKFLREKIEAGVEVPADTFAIYNGNKAKLVAPKQKKGAS